MPLGVGEATAGPTAAAIGNAVSHALGAPHPRPAVDARAHHGDAAQGIDFTEEAPGLTRIAKVDIVLIDHPQIAPSGAGETSSRPTPAALANAVFDASGYASAARHCRRIT